MIRAAKIGVLGLLVTTMLSIAFQVVVVPTASMERTVLVGDHLLIDRFAYGPRVPFTRVELPRLKKVQRGDVVSFHPPGKSDQVYLKRVVAVGGDRVEVRGSGMYVNGAFVERHACAGRNVVVPTGQLYVLGDNRDRSEDSRSFGTVPETNVIGEPVMVLWSFAVPTREWLESETAVYFNHPVARLRRGRFFQVVK